jgi:glutamate/tyrosine decarboxylase-like PLP-dependent enzyme
MLRAVHTYDESIDAAARQMVEYALERIRMEPPPLDMPRSDAELSALVGRTVTAEGIGAQEAFRRFVEHLAPATISVDHPRYLSFIPGAPTEAAALMDLIVGASSMYGGSWMEAAGAIHAENEALRWLADVAGLPEGAGGVFVPGGTSGNLSALVTARHHAASQRNQRPARWKLLAGSAAHSSVDHTARVMDVDVVRVPGDDRGRLTGDALGRYLEEHPDDGYFAVAATGGTTNLGIVDDLAGVGKVADEAGLWFHVDGAYGVAAMIVPEYRPLFDGIERCDSFIVDPHKWLYSTFDCCALLYRAPAIAKGAHVQHATYLDVINTRDEWNPSDYAVHLSRRARGLPFWFSVASHGTDAYVEAIRTTLEVAHAGADEVRRRAGFELVTEPELSVIVFRRPGWEADDYTGWSEAALRSGFAFCVPSRHHDEAVMRLCVINPKTTVEDLSAILDSMEAYEAGR